MPLSTFPQTPLPIRAELKISGTWTDITSRVRGANEIVIAGRGRSNEQTDPVASTCSFTLNNRDGLFSNRNPNSIYYGRLPRNLPVRISVVEDRSFAILDLLPNTEVKTTDKASLRVTGDIDIRAEIDSTNHTQGTLGYHVASRYVRTASANRSWYLATSVNGYPFLSWSTDGTAATVRTITSSVPIPVQYGPIAIRVTLDVDNGAAGCTAVFYTSDTISGTWTQLGSTQVQAGITSIFAGTADLELGKIDNGTGGGVVNVGAFAGRIYGFELRNGIAGTLVANAAIYSQARGTTSWSDGLAAPNTWTVGNTAEITPDNRRFCGEISALPLEWDSSGKDVWVSVEAADIRRRLSKGAVPLTSALRQYFGSLVTAGSAVGGYWPCEDGSQAKQLASVSTRGRRGNFTDCQFGTPSDLPATAGNVTLNSTTSRIYLTGNTVANTGYSFFNWAQKMPTAPASAVTMVDLLVSGGTIGRINVTVGTATYDLAAYDTAGTLITSGSTGWGPTTPLNWNLLRVQLTQVAGNVQLDIGWYQKGDSTQYGAAALVFAGTAGRIYQANLVGATNNVGTQFAHFIMGQFFLDNTAASYVQAANAFDGEGSIYRFARVCAQIGITPFVRGELAGYELMSAQVVDTPMNVLDDVARTEGGVMYPDRNSLGFVLRTRRSLINQYGPQINYGNDELGPLTPRVTDDDGLLRNSVTATRWDGSTGSATQNSGPNSVASATATPPGVGVVPAGIQRNPYLDSRLDDMAAMDVFLGTWDEPRWPSISVSLERQNYTGTVAKISKGHNLARLEVGDMFSLTNLPVFIPPDEILLMVQGITETLGNRTWRFSWNTSSAGPYIANDLVSSGSGNGRYRAAAKNSTVTAGFTNSATGVAAFQITTAAGSALWGTTALKPGNFPMNVFVGGELITVSGITGATSPQSVNVSARSVNGVIKAHIAGESVQIQFPFYVAL